MTSVLVFVCLNFSRELFKLKKTWEKNIFLLECTCTGHCALAQVSATLIDAFNCWKPLLQVSMQQVFLNYVICATFIF
jgi:hypothetical protein